MDWKTLNWQSHKVGQKGEVLNRNSYRCGFCRGKGIISINKTIKCPACLGATVVRVPGLAVICAYCNGNGRAYLNRDLTCSICKGRGIVPIESKSIEVCRACKGMGRVRGSSFPCLACKGKGVVVRVKVSGEEAVEIEDENNVAKGVGNGEEKI